MQQISVYIRELLKEKGLYISIRRLASGENSSETERREGSTHRREEHQKIQNWRLKKIMKKIYCLREINPSKSSASQKRKRKAENSITEIWKRNEDICLAGSVLWLRSSSKKKKWKLLKAQTCTIRLKCRSALAILSRKTSWRKLKKKRNKRINGKPHTWRRQYANLFRGWNEEEDENERLSWLCGEEKRRRERKAKLKQISAESVASKPRRLSEENRPENEERKKKKTSRKWLYIRKEKHI